MAGRSAVPAQLPADQGASAAEAAEIRELVRAAAEPEGFPAFDLAFGEDSTGSPAVWISFFVESADDPTPELIRSVRRLRRRVLSALFGHGISRVPYIRFRKAPQHAG